MELMDEVNSILNSLHPLIFKKIPKYKRKSRIENEG